MVSAHIRASESKVDVDLSVVVPTTGRRPDYLREAVASCFAAAPLHSVEVVVVLNGFHASTEMPRHIFPDFDADSRIRVFRIASRGANFARNYGLSQARGIYCIFLDDDDWLLPGNMSAAIRLAFSSSADIFSAGCMVHNSRNGSTQTLRQPRSDDNIALSLRLSLLTYTLCHVFRRAWLPADAWNTKIDFAHDQLLILSLVARVELQNWFSVDDSLGVIRIHDGLRQSTVERGSATAIEFALMEGIQRALFEVHANAAEGNRENYATAARNGYFLVARRALQSDLSQSFRRTVRALKMNRQFLPFTQLLRWYLRFALEISILPLRKIKRAGLSLIK